MNVIGTIKRNERVWLRTINENIIEVQEMMNGRYDVRIGSAIRSQLPLVEVANLIDEYEIIDMEVK